MIYVELLWSFFQIGLFSIGGGYAAMPLIRQQVVDEHMWLTMQQFADILTIAEMTLGPIAVNAATFVGIWIAGIPDSFLDTLVKKTASYLFETSAGISQNNRLIQPNPMP